MWAKTFIFIGFGTWSKSTFSCNELMGYKVVLIELSGSLNCAVCQEDSKIFYEVDICLNLSTITPRAVSTIQFHLSPCFHFWPAPFARERLAQETGCWFWQISGVFVNFNTWIFVQGRFCCFEWNLLWHTRSTVFRKRGFDAPDTPFMHPLCWIRQDGTRDILPRYTMHE